MIISIISWYRPTLNSQPSAPACLSTPRLRIFNNSSTEHMFESMYSNKIIFDRVSRDEIILELFIPQEHHPRGVFPSFQFLLPLHPAFPRFISLVNCHFCPNFNNFHSLFDTQTFPLFFFIPYSS